MPFQVVGEIIDDEEKANFKIKPYKSRIFYSQDSAIKHGYSKVYKKDGNTKKTKNTLVNWYIKNIHFGEMK